MLDSEANVTAEFTKPAFAVDEIAAGALLVTVLVVVLGVVAVGAPEAPVLALASGVVGMDEIDIYNPPCLPKLSATYCPTLAFYAFFSENLKKDLYRFFK
ncbi:hypothetical protein ACO0K0_03115 [Undibacterium sp. SXout11W]|uniref:hypothetical protein n=1 Tax=Undibacterium sp. SXout11W TaxID=3413050 RepID=UPI003BEFC0E7